jgi:hypothetical protein
MCGEVYKSIIIVHFVHMECTCIFSDKLCTFTICKLSILLPVKKACQTSNNLKKYIDHPVKKPDFDNLKKKNSSNKVIDLYHAYNNKRLRKWSLPVYFQINFVHLPYVN